MRLISVVNRIYKACGLNDLEQLENAPEYVPDTVVTAELVESFLKAKQEKDKGAGLSAVLTDSKPRAGAWRELWLITIGHGLTHWYPATFYLLLPLIGNELGLSLQRDRPHHDLPVHRRRPSPTSRAAWWWTPSGARAC